MIIRHLVFDIETTGLDPVTSRITCICAKDSAGNEHLFSDKDEKKIIHDFIMLFKSNDFVSLVSANGKDFDVPFIFIRAFLNGFDNSVFKEISDTVHFDVINDISKKKVSLNNLARLYNFPIKSGNGLQAIEYWQKGEIQDLLKYCMDDVRLTEKVYKKYLRIVSNKEYKE